MEGLAAVTQRIADIQTRISALTSPPGSTGSRSFATALAEASATPAASTSLAGRASSATLTTNDVLTAASLRRGAAASPAMTADGVPVDLAAYGNGKVPASALSPIGSAGHRLWAPAAAAFEQLSAAAARDGVRIGVTDSYRSYDQQVDVARRKGLYSEGGLAAVPGTSDHGWGRSLDLDLDSEAQSWMRSNATRYGFVEDTPREPWHWTYYPSGRA